LPSAISEKVDTLSKGAADWHKMTDQERAKVARACRAQLATMDLDWVPDNMRCLGLEPSRRDEYKSLGFDPFLLMSTIVERLERIADSLEGSLQKDKPGCPYSEVAHTDKGPVIYKMGAVGQAAKGCDLELWAVPSGTETDPSSAETSGVGVVLGAGNQNFLTAVDVIEVAFNHKKCVLLKHHPLRPFMLAPFAHIFQPLAERGAYAHCLDSDLQKTHATLLAHPAVKHIHMTGSGPTHDKVQQALVAAGRTKEVLFTSELGCVTPWIVCPGTQNGGQWSESAINDNAKMLTAAFKSSCSMNCLSPKVLVLPPEAIWPQRQQFLDALRRELASMAQLPPYYPLAHARFAAFEREYPGAERIEAPPAQAPGYGLRRTAFPDLGQDITPLPSLLVDVGTIGDSGCKPYALQNEAFAPVLAIATVACENAGEFPLKAAEAANEHIFGTLSCNLIYPDERNEALDQVLQMLNYGCVTVNFWAALTYSNPLGVWGGAPGSYSSSKPCSGFGFVGNAARIPCVQKCVGISAFDNKDVIMGKPIPYIIADLLQIVVSGKRFAGMRVLGLLFRRLFGLIPKPMPGGNCAGR
jgi:acyl-CoA reductase-like NAD-dependent aldehyde dehydrogenase